MEPKSITAYQSHIEVYPYQVGECPSIENLYTVYDNVTHEKYPVGIYVLNNTLYIPKGTSQAILKKYFNSTMRYSRECNKPLLFKNPVYMVNQPRDDIQTASITFLNNSLNAQLGLNLETEFGKTFCTISHIVHAKERAIIIVHNDTVKRVWMEEFIKHTDILPERLINIDGLHAIERILHDKIEGDIYFVCHRSIQAYFEKHGWDSLNVFLQKTGVGIRVTDEAHLEFYNTMMMDLFSNVKKSIYLTANFSRGNPSEIAVYKRCFSSLKRFGEDIVSKRKHIIGYILNFNSNASGLDEAAMSNFYGFNPGLYMDYELMKNEKIIDVFEYILKRISSLDGRIVIITPKKAHTEKIKEIVDNMELGKTCEVVNSDNKPEVNDKNKNADIISTTVKSLGTGANVKNLRSIICLEPIGQVITCNQLSGRLRELGPDEDNYFVLINDVAISSSRNRCKNALKVFKKKFKKIYYEDYSEPR